MPRSKRQHRPVDEGLEAVELEGLDAQATSISRAPARRRPPAERSLDRESTEDGGGAEFLPLRRGLGASAETRRSRAPARLAGGRAGARWPSYWSR